MVSLRIQRLSFPYTKVRWQYVSHTATFFYIFFLSSVAGLFKSLPFSSKREPWQGQSQECSSGLYFNAQPRCGQRGTVGVKSPTIDSKALIANCGRKILLDGENTWAYLFFLPCTKSASIIADTIDDDIPHLLNPVATNILGVLFEY